MGSSANQFIFLFTILVLSTLHLSNGREGPFFNNNKNPNFATQIPYEPGPNFIPQNQNGPYGLYGRKSTEPQGMSENTRFMGNGYNNPINNNNYNGDKMYNTKKQGMGLRRYYNGGNMYNQEKQGMSDTRFLENGRYFYDLNSENYIPNNNANGRVDSRYGYNNGRGNYGNNENSYYEYNSNNSIEGYQEESQDGYIP